MSTAASTSIYDQKKWGVHVVGVDAVLVAHNFEHAVLECGVINNTISRYIKQLAITEHHPIIFARVGLWDEIAGNNAAHDPDKTDWNEVC